MDRITPNSHSPQWSRGEAASTISDQTQYGDVTATYYRQAYSRNRNVRIVISPVPTPGTNRK